MLAFATLSLSCTVAAGMHLNPQFANVSDTALVAMAESQGPERPVDDEIDARLNYFTHQRLLDFVALLADVVERTESNDVRFACAVPLGLNVERGPLNGNPQALAVLIPHMQRVLLSGESKYRGIVGPYVDGLTSVDKSQATYDALSAVINSPNMRDMHGYIRGQAITGMGQLGEAGETFLLEYMPKASDTTAAALGDTGGERAYRYLSREARRHDGQLRVPATSGLANWAKTKPRDSADWDKAVRTLNSLVCTRSRVVAQEAEHALGRLKVTPRPCGKDRGQGDDDERASDQ